MHKIAISHYISCLLKEKMFYNVQPHTSISYCSGACPGGGTSGIEKQKKAFQIFAPSIFKNAPKHINCNKFSKLLVELNNS